MNSVIPHNETKKRNGVWGSRRFMLFIAAIIVLSVAIVAMTNIQQNIASYGNRTPDAIPSVLCVGEEFTYRVQVEIKQSDTVVLLTEDWCKPNTGICPKEFTAPPILHNVLEPVSVDTPATRNVPLDLPPGDWEFRHCNTSITSDRPIDVSCYGVSVTILPKETCKDKP